MPQTSAEKNKLTRARMAAYVREEGARRGDCEWPGCSRDPSIWHHTDPGIKSFSIMSTNGGLHRSYASMDIELAKCKYICDGHHLMAHALLTLGESSPWEKEEHASSQV